MGVIAFAFSVHNFISKVGADAGFAAIIGLALLVLLYFAQAREIASVRDRSDEAEDHVRHLEARVAQLSQLTSSLPASATVTPPPAPAPVGIRRPTPSSVAAAVAGAGPIIASRNPAAAGARQRVPSPPAGVAAPALTAATRLIPAPAAPAVQVPAPAPATAPPTAPATVAPVGVGVGAGRAESAAALGGPPPATAAGGANGAVQQRVPRPSAAGSLPPPPPRVQIRQSGSGAGRSGGSAMRRPPSPGERSRVGRGFVIVLGLLGVVAVAVVLLIVTSGGGSTTATTASISSSNAPKTHHKTQRAAFSPSSVTVAVLNGTATNGLAGRVAARLAAAGYKKGAVATAPDQTHTATIVAYLPGFRSDALHVASALKLGSASVQPVDPTNQAVACPPSTKCSANVVAIVGADLASTA